MFPRPSFPLPTSADSRKLLLRNRHKNVSVHSLFCPQSRLFDHSPLRIEKATPLKVATAFGFGFDPRRRGQTEPSPTIEVVGLER